jgi:hypothetical protein
MPPLAPRTVPPLASGSQAYQPLTVAQLLAAGLAQTPRRPLG